MLQTPLCGAWNTVCAHIMEAVTVLVAMTLSFPSPPGTVLALSYQRIPLVLAVSTQGRNQLTNNRNSRKAKNTTENENTKTKHK